MCFPVIGGLTWIIPVIGDYHVRTTLLSKEGLRVEGSGHEMINALKFFIDVFMYQESLLLYYDIVLLRRTPRACPYAI